MTGRVDETLEFSVELVATGVVMADTVDVTADMDDVLIDEVMLAVVVAVLP